jgi:hypothetical protein
MTNEDLQGEEGTSNGTDGRKQPTYRDREFLIKWKYKNYWFDFCNYGIMLSYFN